MSQKIKNKKILIASHDAGGAEVLSAWVKNNKNDYYFFLEGPSVSIFKKKIFIQRVYNQEDLLDVLLKVDLVITSTSWKTDLEVQIINESRKYGIPSISYLDHWVNYQERFRYKMSLCYPDKIWVGDDYAMKLVKEKMPSVKLEYQKNLFIDEIIKEGKLYPARKKSNKKSVLFLTQPIDQSDILIAKEKEIFTLFINNLRSLSKLVVIEKIKVRLHPASSLEQYKSWISEINDFEIELSESSKSLVSDCVAVDWVVGAYSMAMVIALALKKKVFYCFDSGVPSVFPHIEFENFTDFTINYRYV